MNIKQSQKRPRQPHLKKVFVKVISTFDKTGYMQPQSIIWEDGRIFTIDAVTDFRPASMVHAGQLGYCYTVVIKGEPKYLFFQRGNITNRTCIGRWWVEVPA